jgi:hypothetical protein
VSDAFVTVATFTTLPEAEAAKLHVESEGIPANIVDAEIVSMDWLLGNAVGYIKLQVPQSQAHAVVTLLESQRADRLRRRELAEGRPEEDLCLACGALMDDSAACPRCGWTWTDASQESGSPETDGESEARQAE